MTDAERWFRERFSARRSATRSSRRSAASRSSRSTRPERRRRVRERIGFPGEFPYTRGVYPSMYRGRLWTMRQFAGFGTAEETNERFRYLLDHGQTGLSTAFDMPSLMGHDSDHPRSEGEVGREGVAIDTLDDMETLFAGHPAGRGLHLDDDQRPGRRDAGLLRGGGRAPGRAARAARRARSRRTSSRSTSRRRSGASRSTRRCGWSPTWSSSAPSGCRAGTRSRSPATTSARPARRPQQELAFTLKDGFTYVEHALERGLDVDELRAAAVVLLQRPHRLLRGDREVPRRAADLGARAARHLRRARRALAPDALPQPDGGRVAHGAAAAQQHRAHGDRGALGGARRHAVAAHQLASTRRSRCRPRRRCGWRCAPSRCIAHETGVTNTIDPLGGSYFVEALTDRMEEAAYAYFAQDRRAGRHGRGDQAELPAARDRRRLVPLQQEIERGERDRSSGSTATSTTTSTSSRSSGSRSELERKQIGRVQAVRARRDSAEVERTLAELREAAAADRNLMEPLLDGARAHAARARSSSRSSACSAPTPRRRSSRPLPRWTFVRVQTSTLCTTP